MYDVRMCTVRYSSRLCPHYNASMSTTHSQVIDAIDVRISTRSFNPDLIEDGLVHQLRQNIDAMSLIADVRFTFLENHPELFAHAVETYGGFIGASHIVLISGAEGDSDAAEKAGFYGERLILTATLMGLATCWVDGSIDLDAAARAAHIPSDEVPYVAIAVGYFVDQDAVLKQSFEERVHEQQSHREHKSLEEIGTISDITSAPKWYQRALTAAVKAPSAHNSQPIRFTLVDDHTMSASIDEKTAFDDIRDSLALGIAKLHAHIGVTSSVDDPVRGEWEWGNYGRYTVR